MSAAGNTVLVDQKAVPSYDYNQSFFAPRPTDSRYEKVISKWLSPSNEIQRKTSVHFSIPPERSGGVIDWSNMAIAVKGRLVRMNGDEVKPKDNVSLCNNIMHSIFSEVEIKVGGKNISKATSHYGKSNIAVHIFSFFWFT